MLANLKARLLCDFFWIFVQWLNKLYIWFNVVNWILVPSVFRHHWMLNDIFFNPIQRVLFCSLICFIWIRRESASRNLTAVSFLLENRVRQLNHSDASSHNSTCTFHVWWHCEIAQFVLYLLLFNLKWICDVRHCLCILSKSSAVEIFSYSC